jgi:cysteine desulfuration protein SufE
MDGFPCRLKEYLDRFARIERREERIDALIDLSERFRPVPERIARRPYEKKDRVPGCESEVYVWAEDLEDGALRFHFAVENPQGISAKALAVILDEGLSGEPPETIAAVSPDIVYTIFDRELSMGKSLGLMGVVHMAVSLARRRAVLKEKRTRSPSSVPEPSEGAEEKPVAER